MNGPRTVQAVFTAAAYPLTLTTLGGGTVTADSQSIAPNTYYPTRTVVSLAASAGSGWSFLRWEGSVTSTDNPLLLAMNPPNNVQPSSARWSAPWWRAAGPFCSIRAIPVPYGTVTATAVPGPGIPSWHGAGLLPGRAIRRPSR